jgi:multidrug efflux pump
VFVVPTMYSLFARKSVPGPNKKEAIDAPTEPSHAHP